ncbi:MAG: glycosyltransferase [bacterium]
MSILTKIISMLRKRDKLGRNIKEAISAEVGDSKTYFYSYWMHHGAFGLTSERLRGFNTISFCRGHGYDIYFEREADNYLPFRKFIVDNLNKVFLISEDGKEYLSEHLTGIDCSKLEVSRLGINNTRLPAKSSADDVLRIISCSRISEIKRLDLIIDALAEIDGFPIIWTHIGDGELMSHIRTYTKEKLDSKPNVEFVFKGYMSNSEVFDFYENAEVDLFLNVSKSEGIPVSIMEAFSFSVPAIATDVGGVREIVDEACGHLISPQPSVEELRNAIITFRGLSNDAVMEIRRNARSKWNESFNAEKNYKDFVKSILNIGGEN